MRPCSAMSRASPLPAGGCGWRVAGPRRCRRPALGLAAVGAALLMGSSFELSPRHFAGDLLALFAGLLYTGYLIAVQRGRGSLKPLPLLFLSSAIRGGDAIARVACVWRASHSARLDLCAAARARQPGDRPGPAGLWYRLCAAADRRPCAADPAGHLRLSSAGWPTARPCRRSTGSEPPRSPPLWCSFACLERGLRTPVEQPS